jgi:hypothetical protein
MGGRHLKSWRPSSSTAEIYMLPDCSKQWWVWNQLVPNIRLSGAPNSRATHKGNAMSSQEKWNLSYLMVIVFLSNTGKTSRESQSRTRLSSTETLVHTKCLFLLDQKNLAVSWMWWHTPTTLAVRRLRQEDFWIWGQFGLHSEIPSQKTTMNKAK